MLIVIHILKVFRKYHTHTHARTIHQKNQCKFQNNNNTKKKFK